MVESAAGYGQLNRLLSRSAGQGLEDLVVARQQRQPFVIDAPEERDMKIIACRFRD